MCRAGFARDVPEQAGKDHAQQHRENAAVEIQHPETGAARVVARQNRHRLQIQPEIGQVVQYVTACVVVTLFRSEEHTSELKSLMRISYAVFCLKKKKTLHSSCCYLL